VIVIEIIYGEIIEVNLKLRIPKNDYYELKK